jgi:hypothetical protein
MREVPGERGGLGRVAAALSMGVGSAGACRPGGGS